MKKNIAAILITALALGTAACGSQGAAQNTQATQTEAPAETYAKAESAA